MSNSKEAKTLIERYLKARIPFVAVNSIERAGVLGILKDIAMDLSLPVYVHTLSRGLFDISTDRIINEDKSVYSAIEFMSDQMMRRQDVYKRQVKKQVLKKRLLAVKTGLWVLQSSLSNPFKLQM